MRTHLIDRQSAIYSDRPLHVINSARAPARTRRSVSEWRVGLSLDPPREFA